MISINARWYNLLKSMLVLSMLLFFCSFQLYAQQQKVQRSHAISSQTGSSLQPNVPDTLTIVAVRVAFQQDDNRLTTGDGTFKEGNLSYLEDNNITIDPLPHNRSYFEHHLKFAENYFEQVSGNKIEVQHRVLPDIYQLSQPMSAYSPTGETFTNEKVARLALDTWQTVEQQGGFSTAGLDPQKTVFVIFHAGVGRDIELIGTTLDKTPQDIPSLSLTKGTLADLLDESNFDGFDINGGSFKITNSLVLPRTLSRPGEDAAGNEFVLQLSLNGLLCASIGSYLGLPDLFNTKTGSSAIGRFGLMDGESFFSYRGLFPPEPSAWEKTFLGWQDPFLITKNTSGAISLPAAALHQNNSIAKYELSQREYFLVENRHRDPSGNGLTVTFQQSDGTTQTKQFSNNNQDFVNQTGEFTETLISGVVTDVNNFDWSLPGGLDTGPDETAGTPDDRILNGGILIWHIDEGVIQNEAQSQTVNANPQRRGVDLEEADGAQDIGRATSDDFSQQARGTAFDFWWDGNDASVITLEGDTLSFYENRFGPDTRPSNESNSGASSFFELFDFSDNQPVASFRIRPKSGQNIQPVSLPTDSLTDRNTFSNDEDEADYFSSYPLSLSLFKSQPDSFLVIPSQQSTYALDLTGGNNPVFDFQSGQPQQPYIGNRLIIGQSPSGTQIDLTAWQWDGSSWNTIWNQQASSNDAFLSSLNDQTLLLDFTTQRISIADGSFASSLAIPQQRSASLGGQFTTLNDNTLNLQPEDRSFSLSTTSQRLYTGSLQLTQNQTGFYLLADEELKIFEPNNFTQPRSIVDNIPLEWPAFSDINDDGRMEFIYVNQQTSALEARNINGALLPNFPLQPPQGTSFVGTPLVAKSGQSNTPTIYITTQDSLSMNIRAYTSKGQSVDGFPLYVGTVSNQENQLIHPIIQNQTLFAVSHRGELKAWQIESIDEVLWASRYGNTPYNKVSGRVSTTRSAPTNPKQILVKKETYNWPNPAQDFTNLRFQTSSAGIVNVKIITSSGDVVFENKYQSSGSVPEEHRISTQNWSNGLYFGMITANVDGQTSRKMIKIVVVQ